VWLCYGVVDWCRWLRGQYDMFIVRMEGLRIGAQNVQFEIVENARQMADNMNDQMHQLRLDLDGRLAAAEGEVRMMREQLINAVHVEAQAASRDLNNVANGALHMASVAGNRIDSSARAMQEAVVQNARYVGQDAASIAQFVIGAVTIDVLLGIIGACMQLWSLIVNQRTISKHFDDKLKMEKDKLEQKEQKEALPSKEEGLNILSALSVAFIAPLALKYGPDGAVKLWKYVSAGIASIKAVFMGYDAYSAWFGREQIMPRAVREAIEEDLAMAERVVADRMPRAGIGFNPREEDEKKEANADPWAGLHRLWAQQEAILHLNSLKQSMDSHPIVTFSAIFVMIVSISSLRLWYMRDEKPKKAVCLFFAKGNCKNGVSCPFLHEKSNLPLHAPAVLIPDVKPLEEIPLGKTERNIISQYLGIEVSESKKEIAKTMFLTKEQVEAMIVKAMVPKDFLYTQEQFDRMTDDQKNHFVNEYYHCVQHGDSCSTPGFTGICFGCKRQCPVGDVKLLLNCRQWKEDFEASHKKVSQVELPEVKTIIAGAVLNTGRQEKVQVRGERRAGEKAQGAERYKNLYLDYDKNWAIPNDSQQAKFLWFALREKMIGLGQDIPRGVEWRGKVIDRMTKAGVLGIDDEGYYMIDESPGQIAERLMLEDFSQADKAAERQSRFVDDQGYLVMSEVGKLRKKYAGRAQGRDYVGAYEDDRAREEDGEAQMRRLIKQELRQAGVDQNLRGGPSSEITEAQMEARLAALGAAPVLLRQKPELVEDVKMITEQEAAFKIVKSKTAQKAEKATLKAAAKEQAKSFKCIVHTTNSDHNSVDCPKFRSRDCQKWAKSGRCDFGDQCFFKHDTKNLPRDLPTPIIATRNDLPIVEMQKELAAKNAMNNEQRLARLYLHQDNLRKEIARIEKGESSAEKKVQFQAAVQEIPEALNRGPRFEVDRARKFVGVLSWAYNGEGKFANWGHVWGGICTAEHALTTKSGEKIPDAVAVQCKIWRPDGLNWKRISFVLTAGQFRKYWYDSSAATMPKIPTDTVNLYVNVVPGPGVVVSGVKETDIVHVVAYDSDEKFEKGLIASASAPVQKIECSDEVTKMLYDLSTDYGNSGAIVFNVHHQAVGLHNFRRPGVNGGIVFDDRMKNAFNPGHLNK